MRRAFDDPATTANAALVNTTPMAEQRDQGDILPKKDNVTKSGIGLQQWGDSPMGDAVGTGGSGTAERAARISRGQTKQADEQAVADEE